MNLRIVIAGNDNIIGACNIYVTSFDPSCHEPHRSVSRIVITSTVDRWTELIWTQTWRIYDCLLCGSMTASAHSRSLRKSCHLISCHVSVFRYTLQKNVKDCFFTDMSKKKYWTELSQFLIWFLWHVCEKAVLNFFLKGIQWNLW